MSGSSSIPNRRTSFRPAEDLSTPPQATAHPEIARLPPQSRFAHQRWLYEATHIPVAKIAHFTGCDRSTLRSRAKRQEWTRPPVDAEIPHFAYPYADVSDLFVEQGLSTSGLPSPLEARRGMHVATLIARLTAVLTVKLRQLEDLAAEPDAAATPTDHEHYLKLLNTAADLLGKILRNQKTVQGEGQTAARASARKDAGPGAPLSPEAYEQSMARTAKLRALIKQRIADRCRPRPDPGQPSA